MKKTIIALSILALTGCANKWEPVYDPRASKEPKEIVRDELECSHLAKKADGYGGVPLHERNDFRFMGINFCWIDCDGKGTQFWKARLPSSYNPMAKCLEGRNHSIINWQ